jgi:carboxylesterase
MAEYFSREYNVIVPVHPGHGISRKEFKKTFFPQWYQHARDIYLKERRKYKKVYLCGHSMGGLIALRIVQDFANSTDLAPDGAITISAPVFLNRLIGGGLIQDLRLYFIRYTSWMVGELKTTPNSADPDGAPVCEPADYINYNFPPQIYSLKMGMYNARQHLSDIRIPMLLMHAREDKTVPFENLFYIADRISSRTIWVRTFDLTGWDHNRHSLQLYQSTREDVTRLMKDFLDHLNFRPPEKPEKTAVRGPAGH